MLVTYAKLRNTGFTVVELVIAITALAVLTPLVYGPLNDFYTGATTSLARTTQDTDVRSSLRSIERELANNVGFLGSIEVEAPVGVDGTDTDWTYLGSGSNRRILITQTYATDKAPTDPSRLPVFIKPASGDCSARAEIAVVTRVYYMARDPGSPVGSNAVYNLYRRTILPSTSNADYCGAGGTSGVLPFQKQSCASGCASTDALLLRGISSFKVDYYEQSSTATPLVASTDNTDKSAQILEARSAKIAVESKSKIQGNDTTSTASIQVDAGMLTSLGVGTTSSGSGTDSNTDPSNGASAQYFSSDGTYNIPPSAHYIDIILIGGGGGGQGGGFLFSAGHGGSSGSWNYITLQRGIDIDQQVVKLSVDIGNGGEGGRGFGSGFDYTLLGAEIGEQGGATSVNGVLPPDYSALGLGPLSLKIDWTGIIASGGGGGRGTPNNNNVAGFKAVPATYYYLGGTYVAGNPGASAAQAGTAPGGAGAGGAGALGFVAGKGANGASGGVWIRSY